MSPLELCLAMLADGVFEDLTGTPCAASVCSQWQGGAGAPVRHGGRQDVWQQYQFEFDETCVFSWREAGDPAAGVPDVWHWYVYLGILERGALKFWMKPMKLWQSKGEPRIPQLSKEEFLPALDEAKFSPATRAVLFTDAAPVFRH